MMRTMIGEDGMRSMAIVAGLALVISCGDPQSSPDDASAGSETDAGAEHDAARPDAGPTDEGDAGESPPADASIPADAAPRGMRIESVRTEDGYTQVRQGLGETEEVFLIITGRELARAVDVTLGDIDGYLVDVSDNRVRARIFVPHGASPGLRDVTLVAPDTMVIASEAIEITPHVVASGGAFSGHGTYQSPMHLCDQRLSRTEEGDTIQLLEGEHSCRSRINLRGGGQTIEGAGVSSTYLDVRGFEIFPRGTTTVFQDFAATGGSALIDMTRGGRLEIDRMRFEFGDVAIGVIPVCELCDTDVFIRETSFANASLRFAGRTYVSLSDATFTAGSIRARGGQLIAERVSFAGGSDAIHLGQRLDGEDAASAIVQDGTFIDVAQAAVVRDGSFFMLSSQMTQSPEQSSTAPAVLVRGGRFEAVGVLIEGFREAAIDGLIESPTRSGQVHLTDVSIVGGTHGVRLRGIANGGGLVMRSSSIRDQTVASVSTEWNSASFHDLNGTSELSVVSGVALEDLRPNPMPFAIRAEGITLNGRTHAGRIRGPVDQSPDFRILSERGEIEFGSDEAQPPQSRRSRRPR